MNRPDLISGLPAPEFRSFYWLKEELIRFCRAHGLGAQGSKRELTERIAAFLSSGERPERTARPRRRPAAAPPAELSRATVIGPDWRCGQSLRAFFSAEIGPRFHFNQALRDFIRDGAGRTLGEAIAAWEDGERAGPAAEIAPQFEYLRHMRSFRAANPQASRDDALRAWHAAKAARRPSEAAPGEAER